MNLALIPARCGSKGVPNKNVKPLAGYPLLAYSVGASLLASKIDRTIVSTDSAEYAAIARSYGAEVPFLRPAEISQDNSLDIEYVRHSLQWLRANEGEEPNLIVVLAPPTPLRDPALVNEAVEAIRGNAQATSLRSARETQESPYKLFGIRDGFYEGLFPEDPRPEYYNLPRQAFPPVYHPDGYVDILRPSTIEETGSLHGSRILPFITPSVGDVDRAEDFDYLEFVLSKRGNPVYEYLRERHRPI